MPHSVFTHGVFTHGTLEIPEMIEAIAGRSFAATAATLKHHARFLLACRGLQANPDAHLDRPTSHG